MSSTSTLKIDLPYLLGLVAEGASGNEPCRLDRAADTWTKWDRDSDLNYDFVSNLRFFFSLCIASRGCFQPQPGEIR